MELKALVFDIDGTLVPEGQSAPSPRTLAALRALQQQGVFIVLATGRAPFAAKAIAGSATPDYFVCACGNFVTNAKGKCLEDNRYTSEEMYALVDFFEDYDLPLCFAFEDGYYSYVEHTALVSKYNSFENSLQFLKNGEDQIRHQDSMPYGASGLLTPAQAQAFQEQYPHLQLNFLPFSGDFCDVVRPGADKAAALGRLWERLGITWAQVAAFGDSMNDVQMLEAAGLSVAMASGNPALHHLADIVAPSAEEDGVAQVLEAQFLQ